MDKYIRYLERRELLAATIYTRIAKIHPQSMRILRVMKIFIVV